MLKDKNKECGMNILLIIQTAYAILRLLNLLGDNRAILVHFSLNVIRVMQIALRVEMQ